MTDSHGKTDVNKLAWGFIGLVITGAVTWSGWVSISITDRPSRDEVKNLISNMAPYLKDKKAIDHRLDGVSRIETRLTEVIERNTEAINSLRVELAKVKD